MEISSARILLGVNNAWQLSTNTLDSETVTSRATPALHNSQSNYFELRFRAIEGSAEVSLGNPTLSAWWPKRFQFHDSLKLRSPGFEWPIDNNMRSTCDASTGCLCFFFVWHQLHCAFSRLLFQLISICVASIRFIKNNNWGTTLLFCDFFWSGCRYETQRFWLISVAQWPQQEK